MMMLILGGLQAVSGLVALFRHNFFMTTAHGLVVWNYTTWGWINLILGVLVVITGLAVAGGRTWARIIASLLVVLNAIDNLAFLPAYPIWSIIALIIDGLVLYALTVHGHEVADNY
jgi:hypothetical protein